MYVEAFALLTPEQRAHVSDRLNRYITTFRELAQETPRTAMDSRREGARDVRILPE
jgi:hypothetical protein